MKSLSLSFTGVIWRFYLVMAVVVLAGFTGLWALALLALPIFLSALIGLELRKKTSVKKAGSRGEAKGSGLEVERV